jgi:hypothetical protein
VVWEVLLCAVTWHFFLMQDGFWFRRDPFWGKERAVTIRYVKLLEESGAGFSPIGRHVRIRKSAFVGRIPQGMGVPCMALQNMNIRTTRPSPCLSTRIAAFGIFYRNSASFHTSLKTINVLHIKPRAGYRMDGAPCAMNNKRPV